MDSGRLLPLADGNNRAIWFQGPASLTDLFRNTHNFLGKTGSVILCVKERTEGLVCYLMEATSATGSICTTDTQGFNLLLYYLSYRGIDGCGSWI